MIWSPEDPVISINLILMGLWDGNNQSEFGMYLYYGGEMKNITGNSVWTFKT